MVMKLRQAVARDAGRRFLESHLGRWSGAFSAALCTHADEAATFRLRLEELRPGVDPAAVDEDDDEGVFIVKKWPGTRNIPHE